MSDNLLNATQESADASCVEVAGPSSAKVPSDATLELFTSGKRCYIIGEFQNAVDMLQQSCEQLSKCYGEDSDHLAEPYFYYGKSLLELVRLELDVLGNAVPAGTEGSEEDSDIEGSETEAEGTPSGNAEEGGAKEESSGTTTVAESKANEPCEESGNDTAPSAAEEVSNLQLAWEVLELARVITARGDTKEKRLRLADIHVSLAEAALENSQFEQSVLEFESALKIRKELLDEGNRLIAEIHFQCGLSLAFIEKYDEAIAHTEQAAAVLRTGISLRKEADPNDDEIESLESILEDVDAKIIELVDQKKTAAILKAVQAANGGGSGSSAFPQPGPSGFSQAESSGFPQTSTFPQSGSSGFSETSNFPACSNSSSQAEAMPVHNITSMVRKKRPVENAEEDGNKSKKMNENGHM